MNLKKNEDVKKLVGDEFTFIIKPSIGTVSMSTGTIPTKQIFYLQGIDGPVMVYTKLDESYNIKSIMVAPPNSNSSIYIDISSN